MTYRICSICKDKVYWSEPFIVMESWLGHETTRYSGHFGCIKRRMNNG